MEFKIGDTVTLNGHKSPLMVIVKFGPEWGVGEAHVPIGKTWYGATKYKKRKLDQNDGVCVVWMDSNLQRKINTFPAEAIELVG